MTGQIIEPEQIIDPEDSLIIQAQDRGWGDQQYIEQLREHLEVSLEETNHWAGQDDLLQVIAWAEETMQVYYSLMLHMRILGLDAQFFVYRKHYGNWRKFVEQLYRNNTYRMMAEVILPWEPEPAGQGLKARSSEEPAFEYMVEYQAGRT